MSEPLSDIEILDLPNEVPAPASEVSETQTSGPEVSEEPTSPQSESTVETQSEENLAPETPDKVSEKPKSEAVEKPQSEAETLEEQFPGGRDQAAEVIGKASELDGIDSALQRGEVSDMASVVMNAWEQAGPAFPNLVQVALNLLEQNSPQAHAQLVDGLIRERLQEQGALPTDPAAEQAALGDFARNADTDIRNSLNGQMERTAPPGYAAAPADLREKFVQAVHSQIQRWAKNDPRLREAAENAARGVSPRRARIEVANLLFAKAQSVLPTAMTQILSRPEYASLKQAPPREIRRPLGKADTLGKTLREILDMPSKVTERVDAIKPRPAKLTKEEAWGSMTDQQIIDDTREVAW